MGREIKRVPLDFDWPLKQIWPGFQNPFYAATKCSHCDGRGDSPQAKAMYDKWYGYVPFKPEENGSTPFSPDHPAIQRRANRSVNDSPAFMQKFTRTRTNALATLREAQRLADIFNSEWCHHLNQKDVDALWAEDRLWDFNERRNAWYKDRTLPIPGDHNWNAGQPAPTASAVNEWSISGMGHDSLNSWIVVKARCARFGYPTFCANCNGDGDIWPSKAAKALYEAYEDIEPPTGEGWQMWETVSEGSPVSPVFTTEETFIAYLIEEGHSEHAAREFAKTGWVMSAMGITYADGTGVLAANIDAYDLK